MYKLKWRPLAALFAMMVIPALLGPAHAQYEDVKTFVLFSGSIDSTRNSSRWFPIRDAHRVVIRVSTTHAAFTGPGSGDVDSTTVDSIATWETLFSDSVSFMAVDSAGTVVTARSTTPRTVGVHGEPYPICADSIAFTSGFFDTLTLLTADAVPMNVPLRAPVSGSGRLTHVWNLAPNATSGAPCGDCSFGKTYMKVAITPVRRSTSQTVLATVPHRTNGLKGLKMVAYVYSRKR
jgi:hypothetical protein